MIHLDTSFLIRSLSAGTGEDVAVRRWLRAGTPLGISALAWTEFLCGPITDEQVGLVQELLAPPTPYAAEQASLASRLYNQTGRRRGSLVDCMIAASAIHARAELATANPADFKRFVDAGLSLVHS